MWYVLRFEHAHGLKQYNDRRVTRGQTTATLKYCSLALQYLGEIGVVEVVVEFLSQSKQPPSKLSKNLNQNRKPSCNSLRSFLPKLLRILVKEFYSVFAIAHPMKTQVGWMYSIIFCMKFVTSSTIW